MEEIFFYTVTDPFTTSNGYTLYKVTKNNAQLLNQNIETKNVYWKRFSDFHKLFLSLSTYHSKLHRHEQFPDFPKPSSHDRFNDHIIDERRQSAQDLLNFIGQRSYLVNSKFFKEFFREDLKDKNNKFRINSNNKKIKNTKIDSHIEDIFYNDIFISPSISRDEDDISLKLEEAIEDDDSIDSVSNADLLSLTSEFDFQDFAPTLSTNCSFKKNQLIMQGELFSPAANSLSISYCERTSVDPTPVIGDVFNGEAINQHNILDNYVVLKEKLSKSKSYNKSENLNIANNFNKSEITSTPSREKRQSFLSCSQSYDTLNDDNTPSTIISNTKDDIVLKNDNIIPEIKSFEIFRTFKSSSSESNLKSFFRRLPSSFRSNKNNLITTPKKHLVEKDAPFLSEDVLIGAKMREEEEGGEYLLQGIKIAQNAKHEVAKENYEIAFNLYKEAVAILLNGVQVDDEVERVAIVRSHTAQYLKKAEEILTSNLVNTSNNHTWHLPTVGTKNSPLKDKRIRPISDLSYFKVVGLISSNILCVDSRLKGKDNCFIVKSIRKNKNTIEDLILPISGCYMAQLSSFIDTIDTIFLFIKYISVSPFLPPHHPANKYNLNCTTTSVNCIKNFNLSENNLVNIQIANKDEILKSKNDQDPILKYNTITTDEITSLNDNQRISLIDDKKIFPVSNLMDKNDDSLVDINKIISDKNISINDDAKDMIIYRNTSTNNVSNENLIFRKDNFVKDDTKILISTNESKSIDQDATISLDETFSFKDILKDVQSSASVFSINSSEGEATPLPEVNNQIFKDNDGASHIIKNNLKVTLDSADQVNQNNKLTLENNIKQLQGNLIMENLQDKQFIFPKKIFQPFNDKSLLTENTPIFENLEDHESSIENKSKNSDKKTHNPISHSQVTKIDVNNVQNNKNTGELSIKGCEELNYRLEASKKWIAQLCFAVASLHKQNVICRDLNLRNVLLDFNGDIFLTYFYKYGNSCYGCIDRENQLKFYVAPEAMVGKKIESYFDWWSVGVISYQLLTGLKFQGCHRGDEIFLPDFLTSESKSFLSDMLHLKPEERLGFGKKALKNIQSHPFFKNINWKNIALKFV